MDDLRGYQPSADSKSSLDDPHGSSSPSTPPDTLLSHEIDQLDQIADHVAQAVARIESQVCKMHNDLAHQLDISCQVQDLDFTGAARPQPGRRSQPSHAAAVNERAQDPECRRSSAPSSSASERAAIESFNPCDNLRLRLTLRPIDSDFESHAKDTLLGNQFKQALTTYTREILLRYQGQLKLKDLRKIAIAHARSKFKTISHAPRSERRYLLSYAASADQRGEDGFIGGLERRLLEHIQQQPSFSGPQNKRSAQRETSRWIGKSLSPAPAKQGSPKHPFTAPTILPYSTVVRFRSSPEHWVEPQTGSFVKRQADITSSQMPAYTRQHAGQDLARSLSASATELERAKIIKELQELSRHINKPSALLRWRELGGGYLDRTRMHESQITRHMQAAILQRIQPWREWGQASKDVLMAIWSPNGRHFAVGASADMDYSNIQYNERRNLLYGDIETNELFELEDHRYDRPLPDAVSLGANARQDMYNLMDPYLYATVTGICYDPEGTRMYTSSYDKTVKSWDTSPSKPVCLQTLQHDRYVQLLDVSANATHLATGTDARSNSIRLYEISDGTVQLSCELGSERAQLLQFTPTCLKFGPSKYSAHFLLAGFGENRNEFGHQERQGEVSLWDIRTSPSARIKLSSAVRNVLDVVWHPREVYFAAALATGLGDVQANRRGIKSYIRTWSPTHGPNKIQEFDCPALDVNELRFHPHRDNYISASCTDGATYLWDARRTEDPLIRLQHGEPIDELDPQLVRVLGYDRAREEADTGVKLVAWDREGKYLYTGSSDGIIKQWNPWVSVENAHVCDLTSYDSHVMTGAFSPDHSHFLVGTAKGSVHILSSAPLSGKTKVDEHGDDKLPKVEQMEFVPAQDPEESTESNGAAELVTTGQIVIHPYLGAGKGPMYSGPYASWARVGASIAELASVELDPDVLANQLHPLQWRKGLQQGGIPATNARERQEWLAQQVMDRSGEASKQHKRQLEHSPTSKSPMQGKQAAKRLRPLEGASPPAEVAIPIISEDDSTSSTRHIASLQHPSLSEFSRQISGFGPSGTDAQINEIPPLQTDAVMASMALRTPSPLSMRVKESPKSGGRSQYTPGMSSRPRASFRMPPEIPSFDASPPQPARQRLQGNDDSRSSQDGRTRSLVHQLGNSIPNQHEVILIDDSE